MELCELCRTESLEEAYRLDGTAAWSVAICAHCGLVQSLGPGAPHAGDHAAFERFRTGREFRARAAIEPMGFYADLNSPLNILDLGAGRGAFVREILAAAPRARVTALETDERRAWGCAFLGRSEIVTKPLEEAGLGDESFDIAYSPAFEYLASPSTALARIRRALKPGGVLLLDTRNISALRENDAIEEWFVPGLRRSFSDRTLSRMLQQGGFQLAEAPDRDDAENLLVTAVKSNHREFRNDRDGLEFHSARVLISIYDATRRRNLSALNSVTQELKRLAPRGVALWGGGKLLESLVRHGGLDPSIFTNHIRGTIEGKPHLGQNELTELSQSRPGVIVVMSDARAGEIGQIAARYAPESEIVHYTDLVLRAFSRDAA